MNSESRQELKRIQSELRKPFIPEVHSIRELPGRGHWAFVPHHEYRERLDEVCPEWESSYTHIEQITSDVICKCTITILGIRKQAIGSVPLVAAEKDGRDVSRGSAADRLAAEAFKNACEAWGVGRYLDDQASVAHYLNSNAMKLNTKTRNKLKSLVNYLRQNGDLPPANSNVVMPKLESPNTDSDQPVPVKGKCISKAQTERLWAIAKPLPEHIIRNIVRDIAGVDSSADISWTKYDAVIKAIEAQIVVRNTPAAPVIPDPSQVSEPIPQSQVERDLLSQEINSLRKRKGLDQEVVKKIIFKVSGKDDGRLCTDLELLKVRDELALHPAMATAN